MQFCEQQTVKEGSIRKTAPQRISPDPQSKVSNVFDSRVEGPTGHRALLQKYILGRLSLRPKAFFFISPSAEGAFFHLCPSPSGFLQLFLANCN
jgi:hypothetical protein